MTPDPDPNTMTPFEAYEHTRDVIEGPWLPGEAIIATDALASYYYARDVRHGPFPEGEAAIATDAGAAICYVADTIGGPWKPGEAIIATDAWASYYYARDVRHGPFPEGEAAIATDAMVSLRYAIEVRHGRFPAGEKIIAQTPWAAVEYASDIIKGRWPPGEDAIATNWTATHRYQYLIGVRRPDPSSKARAARARLAERARVEIDKGTVRLRAKASSRLMRTIGTLLRVIGNRNFVSRYWTTLGNTIYYPREIESPRDHPVMLAHEMVHVRQYRRWGVFFPIAYLCLPLPVGLAWCRWAFEREAYLINIAAAKDTPREIERIVDTLWHGYGWCWPRPLMRRWFTRRLDEVSQ